MCTRHTHTRIIAAAHYYSKYVSQCVLVTTLGELGTEVVVAGARCSTRKISKRKSATLI